MKTEFRRAIVPAEIRSLVIFDHKALREYPADWFSRDDWKNCEAWWMIVDGQKIGCCAFTHNSPRRSLYVVTTGVLPGFRRLGFGMLLKQWQVAYARRHGFTRILTNTRKRNRAMIALNKKVGFKVIRITPNYYQNPAEPTVVMELLL